MRAVELAKVAAAAEALRLRRIARRQGMRVLFGAGAGVFASAVLILLHVAGWTALQPRLTSLQATLVLLAVDLAITVILGFLAMRNTPDAIELDAKAIREQALLEMKQSLTVMSMAAGVAGIAMRAGAREGMRQGFIAGIIEAAMRMIRR
jgi:hypothetical protein